MDLKPTIQADEGQHAAELLELGDAFFELDRDWRIIRVNRNQERLSRKPRTETLGRVFWEVWPETAAPDGPYWREYHRCMEERVPVQFEAYFEPLDLWTGVTAYPVRTTGGIVVFFRDVTEVVQQRARVAEAVLDGERRLRRMIDLNPIGVARRDADGTVRYANDAYLRLVGRAREDLDAGRIRWAEVTAPEHRGRDEAAMAEADARGASAVYEKDYVRTDGRRVPVLVACASMGTPGEVTAFVVDLSEQKAAEAALRESEARARAVAENIRDLVVVLEAVRDGAGAIVDWRYAEANAASLALLARRREEVVGRTISEVLPDRGAEVAARLARVAATRAPEQYERTFLGRTLLVKLFWIGPDRVGSAAVEITERKRAEAALRESEARHRAFFHSVMELAGVHEAVRDPSGAVVDSLVREANDPALRFIGRKREDVIGRRLGELVPPALVRALTAPWTAVLDGGGAARYEVEHAGHVLLVSATRMSAGTVAAVADDITERKRAEAALRESEQRFRMLAEAMPQIVCVLAPDGAVEYVNPNWSAYAGLDLEATRRAGWPGVIHPDDLAAAAECRRRALRLLTPQDVELRYRAAGGAYRWFLSRLAPVVADGRVVRLVGSAVDVEERRRAAEALQRANDALREADRRKDEFLGMLSHELRNPLAPIRNSLYLLDRAAPAGEQARRAREVANRQIAHMTRLVDDLLDVTRIARGKVELRRADVDLAALARRAAEDHRALMHERGLELAEQLPAEPVTVNADATRLAQVLGNLLHNAAKFTPAGGRITLAVAVEDGRAVARVRDTGPGIAPEVLPTIFEPFTQGKQTLARTEGGLGLGLALVKGLIAMHGGEVRASSPGQGGSEFVVSLPLAAHPSAVTGAPGARAPTGEGRRRVLVVDDNRDAADTVGEVLEVLGHDVDVAYDAREALAKVGGAVPDAVFCDLGLPGMDGYEFARQLRALAGRHRVRLVALSGYAQPEDVARAIEAGFDAHVAKPPDPDALAAMLDGDP